MASFEKGNVDYGSKNLGEKEHWDEVYNYELHLFQTTGNTGYVWYGTDCTNRVLRWLQSNDFINKRDPVLDLGCGNGLLLVEFAKQGFKNLTGFDYCRAAIDVAKSIAESNHLSIIYQNIDILSLIFKNCFTETYALCIDKGTFDTISLYSENASNNRKLYVQNVNILLRSKGLLIVVSCNWTKKELLEFFSCFSFIDEIVSPTILFGGKTGKSYTALVFQK